MFGLSDDRKWGLAAIGAGLGQLAYGQPVDIAGSHAGQMVQQRRNKQLLQESGILERFTPEQRAILSQMEPGAARSIIAREAFRAPPAPVQGKVIGNRLVNPVTGEEIANYGPEAPQPTGDIREYEFARSQGFDGSFMDFMTQQRKAGVTVVTNNLGQEVQPIGTDGDILVPDPSADGGYRVVQAQGSQAEFDRRSQLTEMASGAIEKAEKASRRTSQAVTASDNVVSAATRARDAAQNRNFGSAGTSVVSNLPWTDSAEVVRQTDALKAMASVENLNAMRAASPTGGALGQASDRDIKLLQDKSGALDPNSPNYLRDLEDYERTLLRTIHGVDAGDRIFQQSRDGFFAADDDSIVGQIESDLRAKYPDMFEN